MDNYYFVEYTKVSVMSDTERKVKERRSFKTLDEVFGILRFSKSCKRDLGLKFGCISYKDGTINPETNDIEHWINEDISIRPMTDEELLRG